MIDASDFSSLSRNIMVWHAPEKYPPLQYPLQGRYKESHRPQRYYTRPFSFVCGVVSNTWIESTQIKAMPRATPLTTSQARSAEALMGGARNRYASLASSSKDLWLPCVCLYKSSRKRPRRHSCPAASESMKLHSQCPASSASLWSPHFLQMM